MRARQLLGQIGERLRIASMRSFQVASCLRAALRTASRKCAECASGIRKGGSAGQPSFSLVCAHVRRARAASRAP